MPLISVKEFAVQRSVNIRWSEREVDKIFPGFALFSRDGASVVMKIQLTYQFIFI